MFDFEALVRMVQAGTLALPDFQRDFVWEPNRVTELLDSVSHGWPVGSLLMLEGPQPFGVKPFANGPAVSADTVSFYLLDGQQRVTSLFHALADTSSIVYFVDLDEVDEYDEPPFRWAAREAFERRRSESVFLVHELLSSKVFDRRVDALSSEIANKYIEARGARMGALLGEYLLPAIVMRRDIELEALTRIFETLNRTGLRLNAFDLMVAVLRPHEFFLRDEWTLAKEIHPTLADMKVDGVELLKLIALWQREMPSNALRPAARRVRGVRQRDVLNTPGEFVQESWSRAVEGYVNAITFLGTQAGVRSKEAMPSWAMVLPIAYWLDRQMPSLAAVESWYWRTACLQTYSQGANTQVVADIAPAPRLAPTPKALDALKAGLSDQSRRNKVLRLAIRGLLVRRGAVDPRTGESLGSTGRELSFGELLQGRVALSGDAPVVDTIFVSTTTVTALRKSTSAGLSPIDQLLPEYMQSQGFALDLPLERARAERAATLTNWIGDLL